MTFLKHFRIAKLPFQSSSAKVNATIPLAEVSSAPPAPPIDLSEPLQATISQLEQDISVALNSLDGIRHELDSSIAEHVALSDHIRAEGDGVAEVVTDVESATRDLASTVSTLAGTRDVIKAESQRVMISVDDASHKALDARNELDELIRAIASITGVVNLIDRVSKDTRLLALNASIEARRVGSQGRAFGVIADEVKHLAEDAAKATSDITQRIVRLNTSAASSIAAIGRMVDVASELRPSFNAVTEAVERQNSMIGAINHSTQKLATSSREAAARADGLKEFTGVAVHEAEAIKLASGRLADFMGQFTRRLTTAARQNDVLGRRRERRSTVNRATTVSYANTSYSCTTIDISGGGMLLAPRPDLHVPVAALVKINMAGVGIVEARVASISSKGLHVAFPENAELQQRMKLIIEESAVENKALVAFALQGAEAVSNALDTAIDNGMMALVDLFANQYDPITHTEPRQFTCKALPLYEALFPPIIENVRLCNSEMIYAVANDHNGYCPVHSAEYSQDQRFGEPEHNDLVSRNRRLHLDDDTLAIARNTAPHLIQRYRRITGSDVQTIKDVSAPIFVKGRHWGAFRTGWPL
jgi:methyl-accepting chemotaxis protein